MSSTIINMVKRMKDEEDIRLESLFASDAIADDGFSDRVLKRVRRQVWVRRLALPIAFVIGAAIAFKPLVALATILVNLVSVIPGTLGSELALIPVDFLPGTSTIVLGLIAVMAITMIGKMLED